jgi:hypothetical protein
MSELKAQAGNGWGGQTSAHLDIGPQHAGGYEAAPADGDDEGGLEVTEDGRHRLWTGQEDYQPRGMNGGASDSIGHESHFWVGDCMPHLSSTLVTGDSYLHAAWHAMTDASCVH